ncbi:MAG TPA: hypothetical protein VEC14_15015 [Reyranellaceae bacterium]|nr:hypothetical protein [Reyranellaceae bacterium]
MKIVDRLRCALRRTWRFVEDLLKGPGNVYWDTGRCLAVLGAAMMLGGQIWNVKLKQPIDLGPAGLGGGLGAFLTAAAVFLAAKAWSRNKEGGRPTE